MKKTKEIRYITSYESPLGPITLASDGEFLTGLWFDGQKYDRANLKDKEVRRVSIDRLQGNVVSDESATDTAEQFPIFEITKNWLDCYFLNKMIPDFVPPLRVEGSDFRKLVAEIMLSIPYGQTMTYGQIGKLAARRLGKKSMSAQAVGGAVGHNPISIIVPCHRVVAADGNLTGYAGGVDKKRYLLELESGSRNL